MAIVAANVVHALTVGLVGLLDVLIELLQLFTLDIQYDILVSLTESKVVLTHVVRSSEVMDDAICAADASVANERQEPCDAWNWCPSYAKREPCIVNVHFCDLWRTIRSTKAKNS